MRKLYSLLPLLLLVLTPMVSLAQPEQSANTRRFEKSIDKIGHTLYMINNYYLDTLDFPQLADDIIVEIVKKLDPHSQFITADEVAAMNEPLLGNFDGIGVEFAIISDTLTIQATVPGGPSEKVGIKAGDKIVSVDGEVISGTGLTIERVHKYLRGPKGTKVTVSVRRRGVDQLIDFVITRDKIPLNSVDASYEVEPGYVYVKLSRFSATSYQEIMKALLKYDKRPEGIILDLRGNGGGYLTAALQIANEFLDKGELILYTEGRSVKRMSEYANGRGVFKDAQVAILIDENSASASEIVSGAIQDWDRGTIIGRRSFGKGLVQQMFTLNDGSQLRLTIARYHTPSGRVIQTPYQQGKAEDYYKNFYGRYAKGEVYDMKNIHFPDSLKYTTLRLKRTVYGGGGIMPDIFMPADTSAYTPFYGEIVRKGLLTDFVNSYVDNNRNQLMRRYKSAEDMIDSFSVSDKLFGEFVAYCKEKGVEDKEDENAVGISGNELKKYIKGFIIRNLYDFNSYIKYLNQYDKEVEKAMEVLKGEIIQ